MSHLNEIGICQHIFACGMKKGQKCLYPNCRIHDEYNCNLAKFLNLPRYFVDNAKKLHSDFYFVLVKKFQHFLTCDKMDELVMNFKSVFNMLEYDETTKETKELVIIYIYIILDSPAVIKHLLSHEKFKKVVYGKIEEFSSSDNENGSLEFKKYVSENFVTSRRFLSVKKNSEYKTKVFRLYMKTMVQCNEWFNDTMEKRYAPFGNGAIEAEKDFNQCYQKFSGKINSVNVRRSERIKNKVQ